MRKNITCFAMVIALVLPNVSGAFFLAPYHNLTIIKNTSGGDGSFNFHLTTYQPQSTFATNLAVTTQNGSGQYLSYDIQTNLMLGAGSSYFISEDFKPGWVTKSFNCINSVYGSVGTEFNGGIILPYYSYTTTTCTFSNQKQDIKTPVLIVPGILGTELTQPNNLLWPNINKMFDDNEDSFLDNLSFSENLKPIDTTISTGSVIRKIDPLGNLKKFDYTEGLINLLTSPQIGYTEGSNLFTFSYDWRLGVNEDIIKKLKTQIDYIINQTDAGKSSLKVNIIAHSTGGLLVKKYVIENPGASYIDKAVFVGVPNLGSVKAIKVFLQGDNFDIPFLNKAEMQFLAKNLPVVYDLAPSQAYFNVAGSYLEVRVPGIFFDKVKNLNYSETNNFLSTNHQLNSAALSNAQNLHSEEFENFDLRSEGINFYNITGCKTPTIGKIKELRSLESPNPTYGQPSEVSGDETVPMASSASLTTDSGHQFYSIKSDHGKMPSQEGIKQQIVNIISGSSLSVGDNIITSSQLLADPNKCKLRGRFLGLFSPVSISITDQSGNFSGLTSDGSIQNDIPGADYEVWGEHKYVFLPTDEGQKYQIKINGTGTGTFTLDDQSIEGDTVTQTQVFSNLPVTPALSGTVNVGSGGDNTSLTIQATPSSVPITVQPSSIVNAAQSQDLTPPVSTSTITGAIGLPGFYRSDTTVKIATQDPIIPGKENQTSGILKTQYSLDGGDYQTYSTSSPITLTTEGQHVLNFFSTDKAGNNEQEQIIGLTIDKTPPEFNIQFNPTNQDLDFIATDTSPTVLSTGTMASLIKRRFKGFPVLAELKTKDYDDVIIATDAAGNTTQVNLQNKDRKHQLKTDIKSLLYNGKVTDISKNLFHFDWAYDKKGTLQILTQQVKSKKDFNVLSIYNLGKTLITGKDQSGKLLKILNGLVLLKISTNQGDFEWSY